VLTELSLVYHGEQVECWNGEVTAVRKLEINLKLSLISRRNQLLREILYLPMRWLPRPDVAELVSNDTLTITLLVGRQEGHPPSDVKYRVSVLLGDSFFVPWSWPCGLITWLWSWSLGWCLVIRLLRADSDTSPSSLRTAVLSFFPDQSWEDWSGKKLSAVADKPRDAFVQYAAEADPLKHANPYVLPRRICLF